MDEDVVRVDVADELLTLNPTTGKVVARVNAPIDVSMAPDGKWLWAGDFTNSKVYQLDPDTGTAAQTIAAGDGSGSVLMAAGSLWVANHHGGTVVRLDPSSGASIATIPVGPAGQGGPAALAADERYVYVGVPNTSSVVRIDVASNTAAGSVNVPEPAVPCGPLTVAGSAVWVSSCLANPTATRVDFDAGTAAVTPELGGYAGPGVVANGAVWLTVARDDGEARIVAVDDQARVLAGYGLPAGSIDGAVRLGALWIPAPDGKLVKLPLDRIPHL